MKEKQIKKWEKTRAKGVIRFVIKYALIFSIASIIPRILIDYFWYGVWKTEDIMSTFIMYLFAFSISSWIFYKWTENEYQDALKTKR